MSRPWHVRAAQPEDYPSFKRLFPELGVPEAPPEESVWIQSFMPNSLFIEDASGAIAYGRYDIMVKDGYVRNVIVAPDHRRRGLGKVLMREMADIFRRAGCRYWQLNVTIDNHAAIGLYEQFGMVHAYRSTSLALPMAAISSFAQADASIRAELLPEDRDREAEIAFDLTEGLLTSLRSRGGDIMLQLVDTSRSPARLLGVARFSPWIPGAYPFRLERPDIVRPLLEALRDRAPAQADRLILGCEDDPALVDALVAVGAQVNLELFHMRGDLP